MAHGLTLEEKEKLRGILQKHKEAFAWSYELDMPGVDRTITEHTIPTYPDVKPVK